MMPVLPVELGDLLRDSARVDRRPDRCDEAKLFPRRVRRMVLLAALLQIAREPAVRLHVKGTRDILPDDHQGGQITGGAEIKSCINAGPNGDIGLTTASAPCGLIYELGFGGYRLPITVLG